MPKIDNQHLIKLIEAALFISQKPVSVKRIKSDLLTNYTVSYQQVRTAIEDIQTSYQHRGVQLVELASGFSFQTQESLSEDLAPFVSKLHKDKAPKYSRALLETLALIAYKQPITRGEIEDIRGVGVSSYIMKTLLERNWVHVVGQKEVPGRPSMYATTKDFLDYFSLKSLEQLPELTDLSALSFADVNESLGAENQAETSNVSNNVVPLT